MSYQSDKAFLANKVYAITAQDETLKTVFTAPSGSRWQTELVDSQSNGYQGALLKNLDTGKYEFVNRGTELFVTGRMVETYRDVAADLAMGVQKIPDQANSGREFLARAVDYIQKNRGDPNSDLGITGHSLGGAISHILGAENPQLPVTTFNAYGAGNLIADGPYNNITNHVMAQDPVSVAPGSKMPGSTLMYNEADNPAGNSAASALTLGSHSSNHFLQASVTSQSGTPVSIDVRGALTDASGLQTTDGDPLGISLLPDVGVLPNTNTNTNTNTSTTPNLPPINPDAETADMSGLNTSGGDPVSSGSLGTGSVTPVTPTVFNPTTALPDYQGTVSGVGTYVIQPGDTVSGIAAKLGMTPTELGDYLKTQYGAGTDLNSIVAGRGLPVPADKLAAYNEASINGLDLPEPVASTTPTPPTPPTPEPDAPVTPVTPTTPDGVVGPTVSNAQPPTNSQDPTNPGSADAVNGSDLQSDQYTPPGQQAPSDFEQALLDAFQNPQLPTGPGTQYADAGSNTASDAGGASNAPATPASATNAVNGSDLQSDLATAENMAQLEAAAALGLVNSIIGLQNWSAQSDLSHLSTAIGLYNQLNNISGGALGSSTGLGNLGQLGAGLGFLSALESGNVGGIVANGVALGNAVFDGAVSNAIGSALGIQAGNVVPGIGLLIALDSGDPLSIASAALAFVPGWGQAAAIFLSIAGSMFESDIPMKEGQAHAQWDEAGNTQVITDQDTEGGGATATGWMNSIVNGLQQQLAATQDAAGNSYALIPNLLPAIGYQYDADGMNYGSAPGHMYLRWTDENGQSQTRYYDGQGNREDGTGETLAGDFMAHAQGAIAPAWQVQTVLAHWQQGQGITLPEQQASLPQELSDGIHQTLQALTLELPSPATLTNSLIDIDADGYLEQTQWLAANQQVLAIDADGNNQIGAGELLHLNGGAALNSLGWLDANNDKVLNTSDPAFGALRLWIDIASDGNSSGETQTLTQAGITAIDFGSNPPAVLRSDGSRTALTAQTLTGDILGVRYTATVGGVLESKERGETVLHAVNTRLFDGQADHMHGGDLDTDGADGATITVRAGDNRLSSTSANTITTGTFKSTQTSTSLGAGDARMQTGAAGSAQTGQAAGQAAAAAGAAQVRSNGMAFVPLGAASPQAEARQALEAMVRSATPTLFDSAAGTPALAAVAAGAAAVQWPSLASANAPSAPSAEALAPATVQASDTVNWQALEGSRVSVAVADGLQPSSGGASATGTALASGLPTAAAAEVDASNQAPAQMQWLQTAINSVAGEVPPAAGSPVSPSALSGLSEAAPSLPAASSDTLIDYPEVQGEQSEAEEDTVRRFTEAWLLANDSTVNAPAWPGEPSLRITSVFAPVHGSVSLQTDVSGALEVVFLPEANYHGPASFSYTVTDQYGLSSNASVSLEVAAVNDAPVTTDETAAGDEDHTLQFSAASLLANDLDVDSAVDGDVLRITRVGSAQHGQVFLAADGTVSFIPDTNYNGPAQFTYWVGDRDPAQIAANGAGEGYETPATVNLTVLAVNDLPVVLGEVMESDEDIVLDINPALLLANDSDVDTATTNAEPAQVLSITAVGNAQHGSIELLADGTLRFTPERDYFGAAGFSYTVDDGHGGLVQGQVVVNLVPVNDAPDVLGETVSFNEDEIQTITQASLLANDTDVDNPHTDLRIVAVDNATHGTVALNPDGTIGFAPDADYFGAASFTYTVSDGVGGFTVGTATLDILPVNDAPRLTGESLTTDEDQIVSLGLGTLLSNDHDVDNLHTDLSITAATISPDSAANGSVQIVAGEIVFTPTLNYFGQASFNYTVSDGVGGQSQAVVNLTFNSVNDAPVVNSELLMGKRNVTYTLSQAALLANDTDVESPNGLQIVSIQNVQNGTASLAANGAVTFAPTAGYAGRGRFDYVVQDADGGQTVGTAEIDFAAINVNPITTDDSFIGFEDIAFVIQANQLLANDADPDASGLTTLTVDAVGNASNGTVSLQTDGSVRFNPTANFYGTASFQYRSNDGEGGQTWATAYLNVQAVNDAPVITSIWYASGDDATATSWPASPETGESPTYFTQDDPYRQNGGVIAYDPDGDSAAITVSIGGGPQHGHAWANVVVPTSAPLFLTYDAAPPYFVPSAGAWQYFSHQGDPYTGADPFTVTVTDAQGASTSATVTPTHQGSSAGGGGGMCPIVMDLNGNGIELIRPEDSNMFADINGDGWRERIGWAAASDGVLTFDANRDGRITESAEVSFVGYKEGALTDLDGLAAFDTDGDGKLDTGDAAWSQFGVLRDANGNGRQDEGELVSLDQLGITGIGLQREGSPRLDHGNVVFGTTDVTYADGRTGEAGDVMFAGENVPLPQAAVDALAASPTGGAAAPVHSGGMDIPPAAPTPAATPSPAFVEDPALLMEARINKMALAFNHAFNTASGDSDPLGFVDWGQVQRENDSLAMAGLLEPAGFPLGGSPGSLQKEAA